MAETTTLKVIREAVSKQLGLMLDVVIDTDTDPIFVIGNLLDDAPDIERSRDAYLYQSGLYRRVVSVAANGTDVTVSRVSAITAGAAQLYFLLSPVELNDAINEELKKLYFEDVETISLVANTQTYTLPTWIQQKGQVVGLRWRDISVLSTNPFEEPVASYRVKEDVNALTVFINDTLRSVTTYDLQVIGRHNYSALANDAATTTCPYALLFGATMVSVLRKIFSKYGKSMSSQYGPKLAVGEREYMRLKADWLPQLKARELVEEEFWSGPDGNPYFNDPPW